MTTPTDPNRPARLVALADQIAKARRPLNRLAAKVYQLEDGAAEPERLVLELVAEVARRADSLYYLAETTLRRLGNADAPTDLADRMARRAREAYADQLAAASHRMTQTGEDDKKDPPAGV